MHLQCASINECECRETSAWRLCFLFLCFVSNKFSFSRCYIYIYVSLISHCIAGRCAACAHAIAQPGAVRSIVKCQCRSITSFVIVVVVVIVVIVVFIVIVNNVNVNFFFCFVIVK